MNYYYLLTVHTSSYKRFSIDKRDDQQSFSLDLDFEFCVDNDCKPMEILNGALVPIPLCNPNTTFGLPGGGSIVKFAEFLQGRITDEAIQAVLRRLGIEVIVVVDFNF